MKHLREKVFETYLRRRGGWMSAVVCADALSLTRLGMPPEKAVARAIDLSYNANFRDRKEARQ